MNALIFAVSLFDPRGRCDRVGLAKLAIGMLSAQGLLALAMWFGLIQPNYVVLAVLKIVFVWMATAALSKRLHDLGRSAWWIAWALLWLVFWSVAWGVVVMMFWGDRVFDPTSQAFAVNLAGNMAPVLWATLWLHFAKGERTDNRFGPAPGANGFSMPVSRQGSTIAMKTA